MHVSEMFRNWSETLKPFIKYLQDNIENLKTIPLGARISSSHPQLKSK